VDEARVDPERDVVQEDSVVDDAGVDTQLAPRERRQRREWVVAQPEVVREVVPRPERDAGEGEIQVDRDLGDGGQRAVAPGDAERGRAAVGGFAGERGRVVPLREFARLDAEALGLGDQLLRGRRVVAGAWVDEEERPAARQED
jgi:hypothetical protein